MSLTSSEPTLSEILLTASSRDGFGAVFLAPNSLFMVWQEFVMKTGSKDKPHNKPKVCEQRLTPARSVSTSGCFTSSVGRASVS